MHGVACWLELAMREGCDSLVGQCKARADPLATKVNAKKMNQGFTAALVEARCMNLMGAVAGGRSMQRRSKMLGLAPGEDSAVALR
jgi:hypothetical protein